MGKAPSFQFYPDDFLRDTMELSLAATGAWSKLLCKMWYSVTPGQLSMPLSGYARMFGCTADQAKAVIEEIRDFQIGDAVTEPNGVIILTNRRMYREWLEKQAGAIRQARFREKGGGDPERWTAIRAVVLIRDSKKCAYCGRKGTAVDHVVPRAKKGTHDPTNLVACCKKCNCVKGSRTPVEAGMRFRDGYDFSVLSEIAQVAAGVQVTSTNFGSNGDINESNVYSSSSSSLHTYLDANDFDFPMRPLIEAFPDLNVTPGQIGMIEAEVKQADEKAWLATIKIYKANHNPMAKSYLPEKVGNLLSVFQSQRQEINGTNKRSHGSSSKPTAGSVIANRPYRNNPDG